MTGVRPTSPWLAPNPAARSLPSSVTFGVATSSYQIEGYPHENGGGQSIWDTFVRRPGTVADGSNGEIAIDHLHQFREDVGLMASLGLEAYRFSASWSRIMPDGEHVSPPGLAFYDQLVDELLAAGVTPWLTLYHWELPQALEDRGGWRWRGIADRFADYAHVTYDALGDRVTNWLTLNEPWCTAFLGYGSGEHAPGVRDDEGSLRAVHHLLLAHGRAIRSMREVAAQKQRELVVGFAPNYSLYHPLDPDRAIDRDTARLLGDLQYRCFIEPVLEGHYPDRFLADMAPWWPDDLVHDGDLEEISTPIDVLGVNYYNSWIVAGPDGSGEVAPSGASDAPSISPWLGARESRWIPSAVPRTEMDWEIHAGAFRDLLLQLQEITAPHGVHLIVTENGCAFRDSKRSADGTIEDEDRIRYMRDHLAAMAEAIDQGADVRAYLLWTLWDNFEWAYGYTKAFGLVEVDRDTLVRTPKRSAHWYSDLIRTRHLSEARPTAE